MKARIIQQLTYWPIYLTLRIFFGFKIEGQENLKGLGNKSVIFASNHCSFIDGPICAAAMPKNNLFPKDFFPIRFMAYRKFFNYKTAEFPFLLSIFISLYVRSNGSIPVEKGTGDLNVALADPIRLLKNENIKLWIYPEGGDSRKWDGKLQRGKRGVAFLHQSTGAPIVPVHIKNNFGILDLKNWLKYFSRRKRVEIKIGQPIYSLGDVSLEQGADKVMEEIGKLVS